MVLHEAGHLLYLTHEHQHPEGGIPYNRPKVYEVYGGPPNNWSTEMVDRQVLNVLSKTTTNFSRYDPTSIMHYPVPSYLLTDPSKAVGLNSRLSEVDKRFAGRVYPEVVEGQAA